MSRAPIGQKARDSNLALIRDSKYGLRCWNPDSCNPQALKPWLIPGLFFYDHDHNPDHVLYRDRNRKIVRNRIDHDNEEDSGIFLTATHTRNFAMVLLFTYILPLRTLRNL